MPRGRDPRAATSSASRCRTCSSTSSRGRHPCRGAAVAEIHVITATAQHTLASTASCRHRGRASRTPTAPRIVREPDQQPRGARRATATERFKDSTFTTGAGEMRVLRREPSWSPGPGVPIGTLCIFDDRRGGDRAEDAARSSTELASAVVEVLETQPRSTRQLAGLAGATCPSGSASCARSNEHLAEFAGQVSHDIQGPLVTSVRWCWRCSTTTWTRTRVLCRRDRSCSWRSAALRRPDGCARRSST